MFFLTLNRTLSSHMASVFPRSSRPCFRLTKLPLSFPSIFMQIVDPPRWQLSAPFFHTTNAHGYTISCASVHSSGILKVLVYASTRYPDWFVLSVSPFLLDSLFLRRVTCVLFHCLYFCGRVIVDAFEKLYVVWICVQLGGGYMQCSRCGIASSVVLCFGG